MEQRQKKTRVVVSRAIAGHYSVRKMLFRHDVFFHTPIFLLFFSGLSTAYQINPYIKWSLEYISIQPFHFFQIIEFHRLLNTKGNSKTTERY